MPSTFARVTARLRFMKYVPNVITIGRIVVTPIVLVALLNNTLWGQLCAFVLFVMAAISDYVDGKLARSYKVHSRLGQFLDPFADKVLVLGTFVVLAIRVPHLVPWWAVALIALRDLSVTGLRTWAEAQGRSLRTLQVARAKTLVQLVYLSVMLLLFALAKLPPGDWRYGARWVLESSIPYVCLMAVVVFTVFTGLIYLRQTYAPPAKLNG